MISRSKKIDPEIKRRIIEEKKSLRMLTKHLTLFFIASTKVIAADLAIRIIPLTEE